jgi:hypothetical protein
VKRWIEEGKRLQALPFFFAQGFFSPYLGAFPDVILQAVSLVCEFAKNGE